VIIAFGLLGIAGLQVRLQSSEMESYQRTQALVLLDDMVNRMNANRLRNVVVKYAEGAPLGSPVGAGMNCPTTSVTSTRAQLDIAEWCNALQGGSELASVSNAKVGAMIGGRGCVEDLGTGVAGDRLYRVTVAWQGLTPIAAPAQACGAGSYNGASGTGCHDDLCRRAVSTVIRMANLN
jgi:type IV pilus assembly protein PilV